MDKKIKILGILGSPRIGGNTDILLDNVLSGARLNGAETGKVVLNKMSFKPCQECENARDDGTCILDDDMQAIYGKIEEADAIVLASPIFFGSLSAQTKMMIDRFQCIWVSKFVHKKYKSKKKKKGVFVCVEATDKEKFFENAKSIVKNFFVTIDADYDAELLCGGVDKKGSIKYRKDCIRKASEIGKNIVKKGG